MALPVRWRIPLVVTIGHCVAIALFVVAQSKETPARPPIGVKVTLASLPGEVASAATPKKPQPKTTDRPRIATAPDSKRKVSSAEKKPKKAPWRMRTPEEIRKGLTVEQVNKPTSKPMRNPGQSPDLQNLINQFSKDAHATSMIGEPVAISEDYLAKVHQIIYRRWNQPTLAEVPTADQSVHIRLEIHHDGRVAQGQIMQRSKSLIMNQSVKALLNGLKKLPPLPNDYSGKQLHLNNIILRLQ